MIGVTEMDFVSLLFGMFVGLIIGVLVGRLSTNKFQEFLSTGLQAGEFYYFEVGKGPMGDDEDDGDEDKDKEPSPFAFDYERN